MFLSCCRTPTLMNRSVKSSYCGWCKQPRAQKNNLEGQTKESCHQSAHAYFPLRCISIAHNRVCQRQILGGLLLLLMLNTTSLPFIDIPTSRFPTRYYQRQCNPPPPPLFTLPAVLPVYLHPIADCKANYSGQKFPRGCDDWSTLRPLLTSPSSSPPHPPQYFAHRQKIYHLAPVIVTFSKWLN